MKLRQVLIAAALTSLLAGASLERQATTAAEATAHRIVFASSRDGKLRAYSMRPEGSRLTPLYRKTWTRVPVAISGDGRTLVFDNGYVSRANGTGLRRVMKGDVVRPSVSRDGSLIAYERFGRREEIWFVGTDGRPPKRLTSGPHDCNPSWSPDARALAFSTCVTADRQAVFVKPLQGRRRVVGVGTRPKWSPDGRWIAYAANTGLYAVRPDGTGRRRLTGRINEYGSFSWSPDSKRLAFVDFMAPYAGLIALDGTGFRRLATPGMHVQAAAWEPSGRRLVLEVMVGNYLAGGDPVQLWIVGSDGRGLRRLTNAGSNMVIGWTRLAPVLPPAPSIPRTERVLNARTVAVRTSVGELSADGPRVAFIAGATAVDCQHVAVWTPGRKAIARFTPPAGCEGGSTGPPGVSDVEVAGSRVAWVWHGGGNQWTSVLRTASLRRPLTVDLSGHDRDAGEIWDYRLRGDGELLVFNEGSRIMRIAGGGEKCQERGLVSTSICKTIRRGEHTAPVDSVSRGRIAVREATEIAVVDAQGKVVRVFPLKASSAWLDGDDLVVTRGKIIERYRIATGARSASRSLPSGYKLADVDGGVAVLRKANAIMLVRLDDGRSTTISRRGPMFADLERPGLYYSYTVGKAGRVGFLSRSELIRRLG
jgi:dipeptidyl aminopeptidase/acylaminoacyl peptidase